MMCFLSSLPVILRGHTCIFVNIAQNVCHTADFDTDFCASTSFVIFLNYMYVILKASSLTFI